MLFFASAEEKKAKKIAGFLKENAKRFYAPLLSELFNEIDGAEQRGKLDKVEADHLRRRSVYALNTLYTGLLLMWTQTNLGQDPKYMRIVGEAGMETYDTLIAGGRNNPGLQPLLANRLADLNDLFATSSRRELTDAQMSQALFLVDKAYGRHLTDSGIGDYGRTTVIYTSIATPLLIDFTRAFK